MFILFLEDTKHCSLLLNLINSQVVFAHTSYLILPFSSRSHPQPASTFVTALPSPFHFTYFSLYYRIFFLLSYMYEFNEELNDLYSSPTIVRVIKSRRMRWAGHLALMEEGRGVHKVLVGKPEGKRPMGRPRRRWEDNIKLDLQEVGGGCGDWMELGVQQ